MNSIAVRARYLLDVAKFSAKKHLQGFTVSPEPSFDPEGRAAFYKFISRAKTYLEFGSGGSTIVAAKHARKLVSVENDPVFSKAVAKALPPSTADIYLLVQSLGISREWGTPVFIRPTKSRVKRWAKYPQAPWLLLDNPPDLVLIDGRMRVACALATLCHTERDTTILVDDYVGRSYGTIEQFADLEFLHGRMAQFRKKSTFNKAACEIELDRHNSVLL